MDQEARVTSLQTKENPSNDCWGLIVPPHSKKRAIFGGCACAPRGEDSPKGSRRPEAQSRPCAGFGPTRRVRLRTEGRGQPEGLPQARSPKPALRRIWADQGIWPERRVASFLVTFSRKSNTCYSAVQAEGKRHTRRSAQLATSSVPSGQLLLKEKATSYTCFLHNGSII